MSKFFINRPIVAIVISILLTIVGLVAMVQLPTALFPDIAPPEIQLQTTYVGADALTLEQSVAAPVEQQMTGVAKMIYMYSLSASSGGNMTLRVDFDLTTDPNTDQVLAQSRWGQAQSQLPPPVQAYGVTVKQSATSPLAIFVLYSPKGTYDALFLANYGYVNINDPMTRVPGVGQVLIFGIAQYAMRFWVNPYTLGNLDVTVNEIVDAINAQNTVNPSGQIGGEPAPRGQEYTATVQAQGRLVTAEDFNNVIVRARPDGSFVRMKDVARADLGAQNYTSTGYLNGRPAALIAIYQLPGSNAIDTVHQARALMEQMKSRFPNDLDYVVSLDTTVAVTEGIREIVKTLFEALLLVLLVVFVFLQGFRATLIPLLAVPVSLIGTFALFPLLGFSINTLSLFGLVLAIGLVVDDAIVVVEAVEHHIEQGLPPREATLKAMEEVSGPVIAIALILVAVFIPTAFIPGITGRMYQQFAVTIAVSVIISAFNALTLSPALSALLLRPRREMRGPLGAFFRGFNRWFGRATDGYVHWSGLLIRKAVLSMVLLAGIAVATGLVGQRLPAGFVPEEDQGYMSINVALPPAASIQRTAAICDQIDAILKSTEGVSYYTVVIGATSTNTAQYFLTLAPWKDRDPKGLTAEVLMRRLNERLASLPGTTAFTVPPPAIPGVGAAGGITFMLEDRAGKDIQFLAGETQRFIEAARKRPSNVGLFYVRNLEGQPVPLSSLVEMTSSYGPDVTLRFNEYRTAEINATLAHGYSTQQGMRALEEVFAQTMPREMGFDYAGMSYQEKVAATGVPPAVIFGFSLLVVFLILAAQYESWSLPFGVLLGTPIAIWGALMGLWLRGYDTGVFSQIGLVMIIGLAAKNAILIVEFSKAEHERGASLYDAALAGARLRLRAILMTAFAFILGVTPLVIATGSGAASRQILGTTVLGGMLAATAIAIFVIPATFYVSQRFAGR